jgi:hypothetical protein
MAWTDKPSEKQINALLNMIRWEINRNEIKDIEEYLKKNTTRREVSDELGRLRDMIVNHRLTRDTAFAGELWANYEH